MESAHQSNQHLQIFFGELRRREKSKGERMTDRALDEETTERLSSEAGLEQTA